MSETDAVVIAPGARPLIAKSWQRVAMSGLAPDATLEQAQIDEVDRRSRLLSAAAPVLDEMAAELGGTGHAVFLADRNARLVSMRYGVPQLRHKLEEVGAVEGRLFLEETTGTNSIATAFELRRGLAVRGEEHYVESLKKFSCYGEPVVHPITGRVEAVLDITCLREDESALLAPFIIRSARQIAVRLLEASRDAELRAFRTFQHASTRERNRPVIVIGDDIVLANTPAAQLLDAADHTLLRALAIETPRGREITRDLRLTGGHRMTALVERVPGSGAALFILDQQSATGAGERSTRTVPCPGPTERRAATRTAICGEPGTGRTSTARILADEPTAWIDAGEISELGGQEWLSRLRRHLESDRTVVLEAVDVLPAPTARRVAELLAPAPHACASALVLTSRPVGELAADHEALISQCADRVELTPLRQQPTEIPALVRAMLQSLGVQTRFTPAALEALAGQRWTGNLRELRTVVKAVSERRPVGDATVDDLPEHYRRRITRRLTLLEEAERAAIVDALHVSNANKKAAAERLGISRTTLYRAIRSYGIIAPAPGASAAR